MKSPKLVGAMMVFAALALVIGAQAFSVNVSAQTKVEICGNGIDDDDDKLIDEGCEKPPATGCSPGFYKNHLDFWQGLGCGDDAALLTALTCRGSDASCGRSAAAAILDACTGCSE